LRVFAVYRSQYSYVLVIFHCEHDSVADDDRPTLIDETAYLTHTFDSFVLQRLPLPPPQYAACRAGRSAL
jgi:hypothetical protein